MNKHQCSRCKRHVSVMHEVSQKSGRRRSYCTRCIETMINKGASVEIEQTAQSKMLERRAAANIAAVANGTNRRS